MSIFDNLLATAMMGEGGGGGGSSDLSVAQVTITDVNQKVTLINTPNINLDYNDAEGILYPTSTPTEYSIILYKGIAYVSILSDVVYDVMTTGGVERDGEDMFITGNGTITIS